jgi:hypothetical protein
MATRIMLIRDGEKPTDDPQRLPGGDDAKPIGKNRPGYFQNPISFDWRD